MPCSSGCSTRLADISLTRLFLQVFNPDAGIPDIPRHLTQLSFQDAGAISRVFPRLAKAVLTIVAQVTLLPVAEVPANRDQSLRSCCIEFIGRRIGPQRLWLNPPNPGECQQHGGRAGQESEEAYLRSTNHRKPIQDPSALPLAACSPDSAHGHLTAPWC